jgi:hypothetical protein
MAMWIPTLRGGLTDSICWMDSPVQIRTFGWKLARNKALCSAEREGWRKSGLGRGVIDGISGYPDIGVPPTEPQPTDAKMSLCY